MRRRSRGFAFILVIVAASFAVGTLPSVAIPAGGPPGLVDKAPPITCDPIASGRCLLPFPDNYFTQPDPSTYCECVIRRTWRGTRGVSHSTSTRRTCSGQIHVSRTC